MADYQYVNNSGTIVPDVADILTTVQQEFINAFGADLIVTPDTPQGVLISDEVSARIEFLRNNCVVANQINPVLSGGVFLDAIGALTNSKRSPQVFSTISVTVTGIAGTVIPTSATARDTNLNIYQNMAVITLDSGGNGTGTFQAIVAGAISTNTNTLTTIVNGVLGWETVTNPSPSIPGNATQSDVAYRNTRNKTLANQGTALPEAIKSALNNLSVTAGVPISLFFQENIANTTQVINGITMVAKSVYACVGGINGTGGGTDLQVATILLSKKSSGSAWNGSTSVAVIEPVSGQSYTVLFDRPTLIPIVVKVTISANTSIADPTTVIQNALLAYMNGQLFNEPGFAVGVSVSCFELAGAINQASPGIYMINVQTSLASSISYSNNPIAINVNQQATCVNLNSIVVVIV
jgi:uncharacterized phage protein gp47/JayE